MNNVLFECLKFCIVYLDDVMVYLMYLEEHMRVKLLMKLGDHHLYVKLMKL